MSVPADRRRALLTAALAFVQLPPRAPELLILHRWLDSWRGVRWLAEGLRQEHHAVSLKRT